MPAKVLVFDVWGDYAHFRKNYSTSSPLSYSFPPRTALSGLIGAIAGLDKEEYFRYFSKDEAWIGCRILESVKKVRTSENLIDTKKSKIKVNTKNNSMILRVKNRFRVRFELVKAPRYRIYFSYYDEPFFMKLKGLLANHQSVYTPCLGLSQYICNFRFVGEFGLEKCGDDFVFIDSVIPSKCILGVDFEEGKKYFSEVMPNEMGEAREVTEFSEVMFESNGLKIKARVKDLWEADNGERIVFL
jgi:CRISPR-associated protein Cas5h